MIPMVPQVGHGGRAARQGAPDGHAVVQERGRPGSADARGSEQRRRPDRAQVVAQPGRRGAAPQTARRGQEGQALLRSAALRGVRDPIQ